MKLLPETPTEDMWGYHSMKSRCRLCRHEKEHD